LKIERKRHIWMPDNTRRQNEKDNAFYHTTAWRKLRKYHLVREPLCRECGAPAQMVDHIKPIRLGGEPLDDNNLQSLCNRCHASKSAHERWNT
jgi:5-methylcytosine-specific restriction protein A